MSATLNRIALLLASLACASDGRRVMSSPVADPTGEESNPLLALASLLNSRPADAAFFGPFAGPQTRLRYGNKAVDVPTGSSLLAACNKLGLKVPTNCKQGDCGTCTITVGTQSLKACSDGVPPPPALPSLQEKGLPITIPRRR